MESQRPVKYAGHEHVLYARTEGIYRLPSAGRTAAAGLIASLIGGSAGCWTATVTTMHMCICKDIWLLTQRGRHVEERTNGW